VEKRREEGRVRRWLLVVKTNMVVRDREYIIVEMR